MTNNNLLRFDMTLIVVVSQFSGTNGTQRRNSASDGMNQGAIETQLEPKVEAAKSCEGNKHASLTSPA